MLQAARLLLLLCLVGPPAVAAQEDAGGGEGPAEVEAAAPEPALPDAPVAEEAGSAPPKPRPKKKPGMMVSVVTAAANVGLVRNMTKSTFNPIPDCSAFDACCLAGENEDACCKEHLGETPRACGICARAACTLRVDSCSQSDADAQVDKYCDICFQIGGAAGANKAQATARRAQAVPTPGGPLPKPPSPKMKLGPEVPPEMAKKKKRDDRYDRYDRYDRDRLDLDRFDRDRYLDRYDRDRYDRDRYDRKRSDRDRYDRDRYDRDRDRYDHMDSYDKDLERYKRSREERLRDRDAKYERKERAKPKNKPKPKPKPNAEAHDPRKQDL